MKTITRENAGSCGLFPHMPIAILGYLRSSGASALKRTCYANLRRTLISLACPNAALKRYTTTVHHKDNLNSCFTPCRPSTHSFSIAQPALAALIGDVCTPIGSPYAPFKPF